MGGILAREKTTILRKSDTEIPSDAQGIVYMAYDNKIQEIEGKLQDNLKKAGIQFEN